MSVQKNPNMIHIKAYSNGEETHSVRMIFPQDDEFGTYGVFCDGVHRQMRIASDRGVKVFGTNEGEDEKQLFTLPIDPKKSYNDSSAAIVSTLIDVGSLLIRKNQNYGNSAFQQPFFVPSLSAMEAILVRIGDKISRLKELFDGHGDLVGEAVTDTVADLIGYFVLLRIALNEEDDNPLSRADIVEKCKHAYRVINAIHTDQLIDQSNYCKTSNG